MRFFHETWRSALREYPPMGWFLFMPFLFLHRGTGLILSTFVMSLLFIFPCAMVIGYHRRRTNSASYGLDKALPQFLVVTGTLTLYPILATRLSLVTFLAESVVGWSLGLAGFLIAFTRAKAWTAVKRGGVDA